MATIEQTPKASWTERMILINRIIAELNPLLDIRISSSTEILQPTIIYSTDSVLITIPNYADQIESLQNRVFALENP